jgi:hypothetical protein
MCQIVGRCLVYLAAVTVPSIGCAQNSPAVPFVTRIFQEYANSAGGKACVENGQGFKLIGGGASLEGSLAASYPDGNCWSAQGKTGGATMTVWAIGLRDTADNQWDVKVFHNQVWKNNATFPKVTVSLDLPGYILSGGGARVESGAIRASHPTSPRSWEAIGDQAAGAAGSVTSYIIGIKPRSGSLTVKIKDVASAAPVAVLDRGYSLTGGGARVNSGNGLLNSLSPSPPQVPDNKSWAATAADGSQVTAFAVGIYSDVTRTGCTAAGVEGSCLILNADDNATYNISSAEPRPPAGKRIRVIGTVRPTVTTCQQGTSMVVTSWQEVSGSACPAGGGLR